MPPRHTNEFPEHPVQTVKMLQHIRANDALEGAVPKGKASRIFQVESDIGIP